MRERGSIPYSPDLAPGEIGEVMAVGHLSEAEAAQAAAGWGLELVGGLQHTHGRYVPNREAGAGVLVYWGYPPGRGAFPATVFEARDLRPSRARRRGDGHTKV